jgi:hypothetical protein
MKKQKKRLILFSLLVGLLVLSVLPMNLFGAKVEAAESTLPTVSVGGGVYYGVALGSYPVWRHNDGTWQNGHRPDGPFTITHPYTFTFPGWTVVDYEVRPFASGGSPVSIPDLPAGMTPESMFQQLRGYSWDDVRKVVGTNYTVSSVDIPVSDPSTISFNLTTSGVLTAERPIPLHLNPDGTRREELLPNVVGYEYYFPVLIRLELIREGTAYIRHYTTDGQSLNGIFNDRDETLIHGQTYNFTAPTHPEYRYVGYKKRQDAPPESGPNWTSGTGPGSFKYDSSQFSKYYVFFYFEPNVPPPDKQYDALEIQPDPWEMYVGDTKAYTAKARVKGTSTWENIPSSLVNWTTGSGTIATANSFGVVQGKSAGTTTVKGTWNGLSDTASLTVKPKADPDPGTGPDPEPVMEYDLDIHPDSNVVVVGRTAKFDARYREREVGKTEWSEWKLLPGSSALWSVQRPDIASVNAGIVTGIKGGFTQVTVEWNGLTDTGLLEVVPPNPIPVITGPKEVKEGRPVTLSGKESYSPVGAKIVAYEWEIEGGNPTYVSAYDEEEITIIFGDPGQVVVKLHVWDDQKREGVVTLGAPN